MIVYMTSELNLVCRKCNRVKEPSGFSYMLKVCDACTDYQRAYIASRREHLKQYRMAYYAKNKKLLGMRVRRYRQRDDDKMACPLCQLIVSKVNMSTHKKTLKCKQLQDGNTEDDNYRKTVQTVRVFDSGSVEPRMVKYDIYIYTYGADDPGIKDYDILKVISKSAPSVGSSAASPAVGGTGVAPPLGGADDDDDDTDGDDDDDAFSAVCAAAGATSA